MLCNAFSREIPPVKETLFDWLKQLTARELNAWELSRHDLSPRAFYPRVLIGDYLKDQFTAAVKIARDNGHDVTLAPETTVLDVIPGPETELRISPDGTSPGPIFECVILATGHEWLASPRIGSAALLSPWPFTNITGLPPVNVGLLGSSLSGIDAAMALAFTHGTFTETDETVSWQAHKGSEALRITMLSRMGVMPEGDFYYPFPYEPLSHLTPHAVAEEITKGSDDLLERVFGLLLADIAGADPSYVARLGSQAQSLEGFRDAYFEDRRKSGGLAAVKADFRRSRRSMEDRQTIPYRYVLLRASEIFDHVLRALPDEQWTRFKATLLSVFADAYAAVPHLSLARIIALHDAGVLDLYATGDDAEFCNSASGGVEVTIGRNAMHFDVMIDTRGQTAASTDALPFSRLVASLKNPRSAVTEPFRLSIADPLSARIYCLSLPQLLERYPFSQGLAECERNSGIVVDDIVKSTLHTLKN